MERKLTNKTNLPDTFCRAIDERERRYSKGDADYSCTGLLKPVRIHHLSKRYFREIVEDYSGKLDSWIGSLMHAALALHEGSEVVFERLYASLIGKRLSGETDHYNKDTRKIQDYKYTGVYSYTSGSNDEDYEAQLNTYAYFHLVNGYKVESLEIIFFFKDWKKFESLRNPDYPQFKVLTKSFPLWSIPEMESYLKDQIMKLETTETLKDEDLPLCTPAERWESKVKYPVTKVGNKKATKSFDTQDLAFDFVDQMKISKPKEVFEVKKVGGEPKRCMSYCSVAKFCDFGKQFVKEDEEE